MSYCVVLWYLVYLAVVPVVLWHAVYEKEQVLRCSRRGREVGGKRYPTYPDILCTLLK